MVAIFSWKCTNDNCYLYTQLIPRCSPSSQVVWEKGDLLPHYVIQQGTEDRGGHIYLQRVQVWLHPVRKVYVAAAPGGAASITLAAA